MPNPIDIKVGKPASITLSTTRQHGIQMEVSSGGGGSPGGEEYPGPYTVTPTRENQVLRTAQKVATRNITVFEIPYVEVSNLSGGKTATIGG